MRGDDGEAMAGGALPEVRPPSFSSVPEREEETEDSRAALEAHRKLLQTFEVQRKARTVAAPTDDRDVKRKLREYGEPICLFGEGPYERRERLRHLLARLDVSGDGEAAGVPLIASHPPALERPVIHLDEATAAEQQQQLQTEVFYTEGSQELLLARQFISDYSLPRAVTRLKKERHFHTLRDPLQYDASVRRYVATLEKSVSLAVSQIGDERPLCGGKFSPDGVFFGTCSWSPTVKVWDAESCSLKHELKGHGDRVHSVAWHPHFRSTQSSSSTENRQTEAAVGLEGRHHEEDVKMKPEGSKSNDSDMGESDAKNNIRPTNNSLDSRHSISDKMLQYSEGCHLASGCSDSSIMLWRLNEGSPTATKLLKLEGHEDRVNRVAFHPSGRFLGSTSHDETWRLWDIFTGTELLLQEGHSSGVYALAFHPDGSLVITGDLGGIVRLWDLRTGNSVMPLLGHVKQVLGMSLSPSASHLLATCSDDNTVRIWDLRKQRCIDQLLAHEKLLSEVVFEPEFGRYLLTASYDGSLKLWSTVDWSCARILYGHESRVLGADIAPDGSKIGSVSFDRTWKLWSIKSDPWEDTTMQGGG